MEETQVMPTDDYGKEIQIGGARVRILRREDSEAQGRFRGLVKTVTLSLKLLQDITTDPRGAELFAETLIDIVHRHDPFQTPETKAGVIFESEETDSGVGLTIQNINKITVRQIVENMARMSQSSKSPLELEVPNITVRITYLNPPIGSGKRAFTTGDILELTDFKRKKVTDITDEGDEVSKQRRSNIMLNEVLDDCLPHALYQSLMYRQWKNDRSTQNYNKYLRSTRKSYKRPGFATDVYDEVAELKEKAGITKSSNFDIVDVEEFQKKVFASTYQILVFTENSRTPYYAGPYVGEGKQLVLYLSKGHYNGVRSVCALLKTDYYCSMCDTKYKDAASHYKCPLIHRPCGQKNCLVSEGDKEVRCEKCTVKFRSQTCFENHLKKGKMNGKNRCEHTKVCDKCGVAYYTNKNKDSHKCGEKWCYRCSCKRAKDHKCIMPSSKKNEKKLTRRRVFFDIESRADEITGKQHPVLFVALRCCSNCSTTIPKDVEQAKTETCQKCAPGGRLKIIECITPENRNVKVAEELTKWLFEAHHKGSVVIAHNASGYDAQFILEQLITSNKAAPKLILDGTKLIFMEHNGVRLLDSMKFLTMSLAAMGKAFEIDSVKGDFPVLFIKPEHYDYQGDIPEDRWYDLENKSSTNKKNILKYLESVRESKKTFNFFEEIEMYCYNDVYILSKAMSMFEKEFETMTDVCLLEESTTAASAAALVFRRKHLDSEKPIVLDVKPSISMNSSVMSQKYLTWFSRKEQVQVNMSTTCGEKKIGKYHVDGFVPPCLKYPNGLIIEFFGCYWHAHKCRYTGSSMIGHETAKEIWERDEERLNYLRGKHPVKLVWECEVNQELEKDPDMSKFFENYEPLDILHCEKSLAGGRTEVFKLYSNDENKKLRYLDVVSLYPTVMKHEAFPIGNPENVSRQSMRTPITRPEDLPFRGFLSCRILPPRKLLLPVLPLKYGGKLLFSLCKKCSQEMNQSTCQHSDEERAFNGTFTTIELQKALSLGYVITEVYHGVKYQRWVQNDENGQGGLFTSYINQMMEEKIYSSGWPTNVKTDEEKENFCREYFEKEHIKLTDYLRFKKNPGKRAVAKLMLNSLWGKFAQNVDRETTSIIIDPSQFWSIVYDNNTVISLVRSVNDVLIVKHRKQVETLESLRTSAMQLATLTTSYARLRLYRFMELVGGENIIYTDTDSIIYAIPDGTDDPLENEVGSYLGQLTDELNGKMTEFVSLGPKTYCYKDVSPDDAKVVRKTKGVTMNSQVEKLVTFDRMKSMVDEVINQKPRTTIDLPQHTMIRDRDHRVYSRQTTKQFKFTFNKRRLLTDGSTLPFGYCE